MQIHKLILFLAQISPWIIGILGVFGSLITQNSLGIIFSVLCLCFGGIVPVSIKKLLKKYDSDDPRWQRPNPPPSGCGTIPSCAEERPDPNEKPDAPSSGMPSGHSQVAGFAAAFWLLYVWKKAMVSKNVKIVDSILLVAFVVFVMWSRLHVGCHTLLQATTGTLLGTLFGIGSFYGLEFTGHL
jgi:membrane-associated phospholipid phosphatase